MKPIKERIEERERCAAELAGVEVDNSTPSSHVTGKRTIAVGTYTITELYAGRAVESDFVIMVPADDLTILADGAEQPRAHQLKINDSVVLAACRAHTPQFDRLDAEIARYAKDQMREALTAALRTMEISR